MENRELIDYFHKRTNEHVAKVVNAACNIRDLGIQEFLKTA